MSSDRECEAPVLMVMGQCPEPATWLIVLKGRAVGASIVPPVTYRACGTHLDAMRTLLSTRVAHVEAASAIRARGA